METDPSGGGDIVKRKRASKEKGETSTSKVDKTPDVGGRLMCRPPVALKR